LYFTKYCVKKTNYMLVMFESIITGKFIYFCKKQ